MYRTGTKAGRYLSVVLVLALLGLSASGRQEERKPQKTHKAILYEVHVYGSALDASHGFGFWLREVHVPGAGISFNLHNGSINVFRPDISRYGGKDKPPRKIREIRISEEDLKTLRTLLQMKAKAKKAAGRYLPGK